VRGWRDGDIATITPRAAIVFTRLVDYAVAVRWCLAVAAISASASHAGADAIGLVALDESAATLDADYEHSNHRDGVAILPGARIAIGDGGFIDGEVPFGWVDQLGKAVLGNITATAGYHDSPIQPSPQLVALALRVSAPTGSTDGPGATVMSALANPRVGDPEPLLPGVTSVEVLADWRWSSDGWWMQLEAGAAGRWKPQVPFVPVLRVSIAGAIRLEPWLDLTASFITRSFMLASDPAEDFVHTLALAAVTDLGCTRIALRLEVPVDHSARIDDRFVVGVEVRGR
jgi:hypothetical protein